MLSEFVERIRKDGKVFPGDILKVDSFLNHQVDIKLMDEIGKEFYRLFKDCEPTKILTIEASGIAIGQAASRYFGFIRLPLLPFFEAPSKTARQAFRPLPRRFPV